MPAGAKRNYGQPAATVRSEAPNKETQSAGNRGGLSVDLLETGGDAAEYVDAVGGVVAPPLAFVVG